MDHLTPKYEQEVRRFRDVLPRQIAVRVRRSEDGGFVATVTSLSGLHTEGDTFSELIDMVNDALYTYHDIPEKLRSFVPTYVPPFSMAQELGLFPVSREEEDVTMQLAVGANSAR